MRARKDSAGAGDGPAIWIVAITVDDLASSTSWRASELPSLICSLIVTAKMNDIDPQAWLADVLARSPGISRITATGTVAWN